MYLSMYTNLCILTKTSSFVLNVITFLYLQFDILATLTRKLGVLRKAKLDLAGRICLLGRVRSSL